MHVMSAGEAVTAAEGNAAHSLFCTFELLEMILLDLPLRNLFTIQRTNKTFRNTVMESFKLKRKMFLEVEPQGAPAGPMAKLNPLLNATPFLLDPWDRYMVRYSFHEPAKTAIPSLKELTSGKYTFLQLVRADRFLNVPDNLEHEWVWDESWVKMLIKQRAQGPFIVKLALDLHWGGHQGNVLGKDSKLGDLFDWVQQEVESWMSLPSHIAEYEPNKRRSLQDV